MTTTRSTRLSWVRAMTVAGVMAFAGHASAAQAAQAQAQATPAAEPAPAAAAATGTAAPGAGDAASPATTSSTTTATTGNDAPPVASKRTLWPWVIMGTGVALIATAAVLQVRAVSEDDERESDESKLFSLPQGDPQRKALQDSAAEHDDSATNSRTASLVIGTVGFLAVAGSVVLWFFEGSGGGSSSTPAAAALKPTLTPSFQPGYAGAVLGARF